MEPNKPTGGRAYGHIPHLPTSRMGPGDHHCHEGQANIATIKTRDSHDMVHVTVKLDGSCMSVYRIDDAILPLSRAGYLATTSKYEQHQLFALWVYSQQDRFLNALDNGERFVGEWLAQAHGTRYDLKHEPFVVFDTMIGSKRLPIARTLEKTASIGLPSPQLISSGGATSIEFVMPFISIPSHGEIDPVEGAVWRVERKGQFDFMCKWVRPDKVDGCYLPEISGKEAVWNWRP